MVKVEMYKAFDGKIFENREDCEMYEKSGEKYKMLKELERALDKYCEMNNTCEDCIFKSNCGYTYVPIREEMGKFEDE